MDVFLPPRPPHHGLQGLQLVLIRDCAGKRMGELKVDGDDALVAKAQKFVELRIPMDYALLRELAVQGLEPLDEGRIPELLGRKVPQRHSLNVFQEDGRSGPLADLMSHLGGRAEDGHLAEEARDAGALEGPKALVCVDFVLVAVGSLGVPLLENDARRQELLW